MPLSLEELLNRYANKTATPEEKEALMQLLQENKNDEDLQQLIDKMIAERPVKYAMPEANAQAVLQAIFEADEASVVHMETTPVRRLSFGRFAAAAAVLVLLTVGGWLLLNRNSQEEVAQTNTIKSDVAPGGNKAVLKLADGSTIVLDNAANGIVAHEGNTEVVKLNNGQLKYEKGKQLTNEPLAYNTLSTPNGGEYMIALPDGSKVWLNAASSITYPTTFGAGERKVQVTGEAYFEVAKLVTVKDNKRVPFVVDITNRAGNNLGQVQVLGTHFNINAYDDEKAIKTTLLEGKVKVVKRETENRNTEALLKPGEQAVITVGNSPLTIDHSPLTIDHSPDRAAVMAWRNGVFHFEKADLKTVMRQLSRWYDVEVEYKRNIDNTDPLFFEVSRNTNLSDVLKALNLAGSMRFSIEGKKIIVL